jgi:DNA polymerase IV (DinB-like DNA polymerase)
MTAVLTPEPCIAALTAPEGPLKAQIILHLDMDSFYASVEMQRKPELRNKPVIVGADPKGGRGRGVVCTCSYEARAFGIHSAMPVSHAYILCPHAIFLPPDFDQYARVSEEIMDLLRSTGYRALPVSIDEAFLDISSCKSFAGAAEFGRQIQEKIQNRFGLTCSIGIGPGKTIAKIASDYRKPGGLTIVEPPAARDFLAPLPVKKIPGVGKKAEALLLELGIRTIGDLAATDIQVLLCRLGRGVVHLHELALGNDAGELEEYDGIKSLSRETTFETDTDDPAFLLTSLEDLAAAVHQSLADDHLRCRTVTIKLRYQGFETRTKSRTLSHYTSEPEPIRTSSQALLREMYDGRKVRLIGIRLSSFEKKDACQMTLGV